LILSAKYVFIKPDFEIPEEYNGIFGNPLTNPISVDSLRVQTEEKICKVTKLLSRLEGRITQAE